MLASLLTTSRQPGGAERSSVLSMALAVFALLAIAGLLFAFQQVVHAAVNKADSKRIADTAFAETDWRCKARTTGAARQSCLAIAAGARP